MQKNTQNTEEREDNVSKPDKNSEKEKVIEDANLATPSGKKVLGIVLFSFIGGVLGAVMTLFIYLKYFSYPPVRYYSFDLSEVVKTAEDKIMKQKPGKNTSEIKKEIDNYLTVVGGYVNYYARKGIVFVGGATLGKSPYVSDITGGFKGYYENYRKSKNSSEQ